MRHLVNLGAVIASVAMAMAVAAGTGYKLGWWDLRMGFDILEWAFYAGAGAAAIGLLGLLFSQRRGVSLLILLIGGAVAAMICLQVMAARSVPPIHDITTDLDNPPEFIAVLDLRKEGENSTDYAGKMAPPDKETGEVRHYADVQRGAYPHIAPAYLDLNEESCFDLAFDTAKGEGWEIVASSKAEGRIEATDTTFWFGFKDDVVIRLTMEEEDSCRVDMRSASRIGVSDVGVNAKRIASYMLALEKAAG